MGNYKEKAKRYIVFGLQNIIIPFSLFLVGWHLQETTTPKNFISIILGMFTVPIPIWIFMCAVIIYYTLGRIFKKEVYTEKQSNYDSSLYKKISAMFRSGSILQYLENHSFANSFPHDLFDSLFRVEQYINDTDYEFFNKELEAVKDKLFRETKEFMNLLAHYTFVIDQNTQGIPHDRKDYDKDRINELNTVATDLLNKYRNFERKAKELFYD